MSNICIGLKKISLGALDTRERDKDKETGLKEGEVIEMSIYKCFHYAMLAPSLLIYLPVFKETPAASSSPSRSAIEV